MRDNEPEAAAHATVSGFGRSTPWENTRSAKSAAVASLWPYRPSATPCSHYGQGVKLISNLFGPGCTVKNRPEVFSFS